jgi:RNA polymerase sigma-70 factor (ECF subfamily)
VTEVLVKDKIEETFSQIYDDYMPKVFRYIYYRVNNEQLTEDLTSSVFEKALVNFKKYSSSKASFSTWILKIAQNTVIDHYRTSSRREFAPLDVAIEIPAKDLSPEEELEGKEEREILRMNLLKLTEEEQEIIRLKFSAELNNRQIAKMIGISESNVGVRLFRAVRKLRDSFQEFSNE